MRNARTLEQTPGRLLREARTRHGLTQEQLAIRAGTTQTAISRIERDEQSPTVDHLSSLLACLGEQLELAAQPGDPWTDPAHIRAFRRLDVPDRLDHALTSSASLAGMIGSAEAARDA